MIQEMITQELYWDTMAMVGDTWLPWNVERF